MKLKNCVVGTKVRVKSDAGRFEPENAGRKGTIIQVDVGSGLDVQVEFKDGVTDWGNHIGLRLRKPKAVVQEVQPETVKESVIKVGSKVRIAKSSEYCTCGSPSNPQDVVGEVTEIRNFGILPVRVSWSNGFRNQYTVSDLELVNE